MKRVDHRVGRMPYGLDIVLMQVVHECGVVVGHHQYVQQLGAHARTEGRLTCRGEIAFDLLELLAQAQQLEAM